MRCRKFLLSSLVSFTILGGLPVYTNADAAEKVMDLSNNEGKRMGASVKYYSGGIANIFLEDVKDNSLINMKNGVLEETDYKYEGSISSEECVESNGDTYIVNKNTKKKGEVYECKDRIT